MNEQELLYDAIKEIERVLIGNKSRDVEEVYLRNAIRFIEQSKPEITDPTISKKETVYYADNELEKLAVFIMKCFPNEPRRIDVSESAADVAIRLLTKFYEPQKNLQVIVKNYDSTVFTTELPEDEAMKLIEGWKGNE